MKRAPLRDRHVLFLTGTRADFGKLKPLILRVQGAPGFTSSIFATGLHMLERYGSTLIEIGKAGCHPVHSFANQDASGATPMEAVLANTIHGLSGHVRRFRPDLLIVHGDRVETLAGAIVGALNNILVGHVEGGEISGTVDELIRHAVTKLSHLHFVANAEARARLLQLGERPESISVIGSPDIDVMLSDALPTIDQVRTRYQITFPRYVILLYHPVTTEPMTQRARARAVVQGVRDSGRDVVIIYPNNDAGSDQILAELDPLAEATGVRLLPSMRFEYFLALLKHADAIVGNSSAGIREAPVYGVPTINVGTRQHNRFHGPSIIDVPDDAHSIATALGRLPPRSAPSLHFGSGNSAELFFRALQSSRLWRTSAQKQFQDLALPVLAAGEPVPA